MQHRDKKSIQIKSRLYEGQVTDFSDRLKILFGDAFYAPISSNYPGVQAVPADTYENQLQIVNSRKPVTYEESFGVRQVSKFGKKSKLAQQYTNLGGQRPKLRGVTFEVMLEFPPWTCNSS